MCASGMLFFTLGAIEGSERLCQWFWTIVGQHTLSEMHCQ
jgi:hypothetical protein